MEIINRGILYENPLPHLRSIQSMFSGLCRLPDGTLLASMQLGEAFEAVNCTSYIAKSTDNGATWSMPEPMFDKSGEEYPLEGVTPVEVRRFLMVAPKAFGLVQQWHLPLVPQSAQAPARQ